MDAPRVRLSYRDLYPLKWLLGNLLGLVAVWTLVSLHLVFALWGALVAGAIVFACLKPLPVQRLTAHHRRSFLSVILAVSAVDFVLSSPDLFAPLVRLLPGLILYRCTGPRRGKQDLQLIFLALLATVVGGTATQSPLFAVQLLLSALLTILLLFFVTLARGWEHTEIDEFSIWTRYRTKSFLKRMAQVFGVRLFVLTGGLFGCLMILASAIFFVLPRIEGARAEALGKGEGKALSGFSDRVEFGEVTAIQQDDRIVLRVDAPYDIPPPETLYLRMTVLDAYTGRSFETSPSARLEGWYEPTQTLHGMRLPTADPGENWAFYLEGNTSRYLPSVGTFESVHFHEATSANLNPIVRVTSLAEPKSRLTAYRLAGVRRESHLPATIRDLALRRDSEPIVNELAIDLPYPKSTRVLPLSPEEAAQLKATANVLKEGGAIDAREFARRAITWLRERHNYSLASSLPVGAGDPVFRWMHSREPGHCELFAGSLILLARAGGFPARMAVGFAGGEWNSVGEYWAFRQSDAHAWVEIFDATEAVWRRVDPTPGYALPGEVETVSPVASGGGFAARTDAARMLWYRRIVRYDGQDQQKFFDRTKAAFASFGSDLGQLFSGENSRRVSLMVSVSVLGLTGLVVGGVTAYRRHVQRLRRHSDRIRRRAGELLQQMRESRKRRSEQGEEVLAPFLEEGKRLDARLLAIRYGQPVDSPDEAEALFTETKTWLRQRGK